MLLLALLACSSTPVNPCGDDDDKVLINADGATLTCGQARRPTRFLRVLSGRPLPPGSTANALPSIQERFLADPEATTTWLDGFVALGHSVESSTGLAASELRAHHMWLAFRDKGPIRSDSEDLWNIQTAALSIYGYDDDEELALAESDMEAWIGYASLCREVQNAGTLKMSIAGRGDAYATLKERFESGTREEQIAIASLGPVWDQIKEHWKDASYARQQAWIQRAPLPPPMTATSLGYYQAIVEGDVVGHATMVHERLGPFAFRDGVGYFGGSEP